MGGNGWQWQRGWWWMVMVMGCTRRHADLPWCGWTCACPSLKLWAPCWKQPRPSTDSIWQHRTPSHSMSNMWNSLSIPVIWALVVPPIQHISTYFNIVQHISTCSCSIPVTKDRVKALLFGEGSRTITAASLRGLASCVFHKMWTPSHGIGHWKGLTNEPKWITSVYLRIKPSMLYIILTYLTSEESESQKLASRWCVQHSWEHAVFFWFVVLIPHLTLVFRCTFSTALCCTDTSPPAVFFVEKDGSEQKHWKRV